MNRPRVFAALILSMVVLFGYPIIYNKLFPPKPFVRPPAASPTANSNQPAAPATDNSNQPTVPPPDKKPNAATSAANTPPPAPQPSTPQQETQAQAREITVTTPYWTVVLSSKGATAQSWQLDGYKDDGKIKSVKGADNNALNLIPSEIPEDKTPKPFSLRLPDSPDIEAMNLNAKNFEVKGADEGDIKLAPGDEPRTIIFSYTIGDGTKQITATKTFKFYADQMYCDVTAEVKNQGNDVPVQLIIGPRFGDRSDEQVGSYSTPSQIITYSTEGKREYALPSSITPTFATIKEIHPEEKKIVIDKLPDDDRGSLDQIKIVSGKNSTFVGYARLVGAAAPEAKDRFVLTLDGWPEGIQPEQSVARAFEAHNKGYRWAAMADHYFAMVAVPEQPFGRVDLTNVHTKVSDRPESDYPSVAVTVNPGSTIHIFVGPKDSDLLASVGKSIGTDLDPLIDYGFFSFLVRPLIPVLAFALGFFANLLHNYGWAIVIVTVLINLALSPLRFHSSKKMKKAAKYQPRIKELQEKMKKLKENPKKYEAEIRKVQEEQVALMKEANPLGGCLPLLLQLPIFWAVYMYLQSSLDVRHAPWLYIKDLSRADPTYILPIVMCVTMIASTKLTPQPAQADPSMKMQRIMMTWLMPILLTWFFFFGAPSGLVLYWMVGNIVGVLIQLWINKRTAEPAAEAAIAGGKSGGKPPSRDAGKTGQQKGGKNRKGKQRGGAEAEGF